MSENEMPASLQEVIRECVLGYFADRPGMPLAYVCAVDWIDGEDGAQTLTISTFESQPTHRSMGLVRYMDSWFEDDAINEMNAACYAAATDEDED